MILALLLAAQAAASIPDAVPDLAELRFDKCVDLATNDPAAAEREAGRWQIEGGKFLAHQCLGMAFATEQRWSGAATEFEAAARAAEIARDRRAANYWAQAGNAWLAGGDATKARAALDAALSAATLTGLLRGEAELDRARALVAGNQLPAARADLDRAIADAPADPLAWLLSATLARRMKDIARAEKDIVEATRLSPDDPAIALETGNIAAAHGDAEGAKAAWTRVTTLRPDSDAARQASAALAQFDGPAPGK